VYKIEVLSDPTGAFAESKLPDVLGARALAFCFDSERVRAAEAVEAGGGVATIEDELTGAQIKVTKEG
jgi:hypothetical protein